MVEWISVAGGVVLVVIGLNDVFHTLFHPAGQGRLSTLLVKVPWRLTQRLRRRPGRIAGPAGIVLVVLSWMLLQALGWALIYLPYVPGGFSYSPGISPGRYPDFAEALYISLVTLATLGFGDVVAVSPVLRVVSPLQAVTGFMLLTAAVTWLNQLYPTLSRGRALARRLALLRRSGYLDSLADADSSSATLLQELAAQVTQVRVDLGQNAEVYYFTETDSASCLPLSLQHARELALRAQESAVASAVAAGAALEEAVADFADLVGTQFLPDSGEGAEAVLEAAVVDHGCRSRP